jgi:hypothetical protein
VSFYLPTPLRKLERKDKEKKRESKRNKMQVLPKLGRAL